MAYTGTSIVDYLKSVGQDSSYTARSALAQKYGITGYTGSADQNLKLLGILNAPTPAPVVAPAPIAEAFKPFYSSNSTATGGSTTSPTVLAGNVASNPPANALNTPGYMPYNQPAKPAEAQTGATYGPATPPPDYAPSSGGPYTIWYKMSDGSLYKGATSNTYYEAQQGTTWTPMGASLLGIYYEGKGPQDIKPPVVPITPYSASTYTGTSIVDYLKSLGQDSSFAARDKIAQTLGIQNYTGSADQNLKILGILRSTSTNVNTTDKYIQDPNNPNASIPNPNYKAPVIAEGAGAGTVSIFPKNPVKDMEFRLSNALYKYDGTAWKVIGTYDDKGNLIRTDQKIVENKVAGTSDGARDTSDTSTFKFEEAAKQDEEIAKLTREKQIQQLKLELEAGLTKPTVPDLTSDYDALRSKEGIPAIESQISALDAQIADTEASLRQGLYDEEGKLRPMELIGTRQNEIKRQATEAVDALNRRKAVLVDELSTKTTLINNIMNLTQTDYSNASSLYNSQFSQNLQMINLIEGRATREDQEANAQTDDARANLTLLTNMIKASGKTFDELDNNMKVQLQQLEMKAGLPIGVTAAFMNQYGEMDVLSTTTGYDASGNQVVTFIYKDPKTGMPGTVKTVVTGGVKAESDSTTLSPEEKAAIKEADWAAAEQFILDNPDASLVDLKAGIARYTTQLTDTDINTVLKQKGIVEETYFSDKQLQDYAYKLLITNKDTAATKAMIESGELLINKTKTDMTKAQITKLLGYLDSGIGKEIAADPTKYKIDGETIKRIRTLWPDEKVYTFGASI